MKNNKFKSYDELPITLNANDVSNILGISRGKSYDLLRSSNFPTLMLGKRKVVLKNKFIEWIESNSVVC